MQAGLLYPVRKADSCPGPSDFRGSQCMGISTMSLNFPKQFPNISRIYNGFFGSYYGAFPIMTPYVTSMQINK
jgi:hypothetical protein